MTEIVLYQPPAELATNDTTVALRQSILAADDIRRELVEAGNWEAITCAIVELKKIKQDVDILLRQAEEDVAALLPAKKVVLDGVGLIEKRTASSRKWDSEALLARIVRAKMDPDGTGEITLDNVFAMLDTLKKVLPLTGSLGWRVTAIKDEGFDPNEFSEQTLGRSSIQITSNEGKYE